MGKDKARYHGQRCLRKEVKLGPYSKKKEELKKNNQLDKFGRVVDSTPEAWKLMFGDPEKATKVDDVKKQLGIAVAEPVKEKEASAEASAEEVVEKKEKKDKKE